MSSFLKIPFSSYISQKLYSILDYFWAVRRDELKKFFLITLLMFSILFIQNIIRALKDSIINTMIGTETISFLKFWGVMPAVFLVSIIYVKMVKSIKAENIFYIITSAFLIFFAIFAFYLLPNHKLVHLDQEKAKMLVMSYPNLKWFILLLSNWSFSLFYIMAELWQDVMFALLFWQFVNNITNVEQSQRFYPLFGLFGQTALYFSGLLLSNLTSINIFFSNLLCLNSDKDIVSGQIILTLTLFLGSIIFIVFYYLNHNILNISEKKTLEFIEPEKSISIIDSFKLVITSKYIMLIATLLICYGIAINLVEGPWKASVTKIYKTPTEFAEFMGGYLKYMGIVTICFVIIGSNIVRKFGWFAAAMTTPIIVFTTGMLFFSLSNFEIVGGFFTIFLAISDPSILLINIGLVQNVLSKSSKYTLFDSTKEMAYVPLDAELKTNGKAVADVIGSKLGKSASAFLQSMIFIIMPHATYHSLSIYLMITFVIICCIWIYAIFKLNFEYKKIIKL